MDEKANGFSTETENLIVKTMNYHIQGTSVIFSGPLVNAEMSRYLSPLPFPYVKLALLGLL